MALIHCPECGREVSDRATSCPNCGCPLTKEPETALFTLQRESRAYFCGVVYDVYLDYVHYGKIKNGGSITETLVCGTHHLKLIDKNNFNTTVYDSDFYIGEEGLKMSFAASMKPKMKQSTLGISGQNSLPTQIRTTPAAYSPQPQVNGPGGRSCPKCGGAMTIQTVSESRKTGCGTILLYFFLALTILGLLIVIPLALRKKTDTVTYAVCQRCGHKVRI